MKTFFSLVAICVSVLFLSACQSRNRTIQVLDAQTNAPISGAFVYSRDYNAFDSFANSGLYKTDENGIVSIGKSSSNFIASAGKEGYQYSTNSYLTNKGEEVIATLKLSPETPEYNSKPKIEYFKPFPKTPEATNILAQMRQYFSKRNTIMAIEGEPYIMEVQIKVFDAYTKAPIPNAMVFVRSGSYATQKFECMEVTDENGNARASINLLSPNINIDSGKEGYSPTKRFSADPNKHGIYIVYLTKGSIAESIVLGDTSEFSRSKTNNRLWERFKNYYISQGGYFKYFRETR